MNAEKPRCKALTKSGNPCGAAPTATGLCFFHGNPNKASELGRFGGRQNRRPKEENANHLPKMGSAASASARIESLYHDVETGSIKPPVANVLIKLTNLQLRMEEKTVIDDQLAELEERIRILKSMKDSDDIEDSISDVEGD